MKYFQLNILNNFNLLWCFRWHGTNKCKWHFLSWTCSLYAEFLSPPCHGAALFPPITLCFLSYSCFRHFTLNHYGPKPSWSVVPCGTTSASAKEVHMHFRLAAIVLGFPKSCASARLTCAKPPPRLAQVFCHVSELGPRATHGKRNVSRGKRLRHMAIDLCQPRGGLCTSNRARVHDLGNQKLQNYVIASLKWIWCIAACICSTHMNP